MHLDPLDAARLFLAVAVLGFAAYTDWRWRRAPDALWWVLAGAGAVLLVAHAMTQPLTAREWPLLGVALLFAGLAYALYWLGLLAGGADAKALMALAVLFPLPLHLGAFPLLASPLPPAFGVLGNALLAFLAVPLALLARNLARRDLRWPHALLGFRMPLARARRAHVWPMEHVQDGEVRTMLMPSRFVWEDADWEALGAAGKEQLWVTPKVPFMVPLLVGVVVTAFLGDVVSALLLPLLP